MRINRIALSISLAFAATFSCLALANAGNPAPASDATLATVNGEPVTTDDLVKQFTKRHGGHAKFLGGDIEARQFLNMVIDERLFIQEGYNIGLDRDESVVQRIADYERQRTTAWLVSEEIDNKSNPTPDEVRSTWKDNLGFFFGIRQIAVETREEAEQIRNGILSGGDIDSFARHCSIAESSRNGGYLLVNWGRFTPEWERAVFQLEPGEVSPVIETPGGYEIVIMGDRVESPLPDFTKVSGQVEAVLQQRKLDVRRKEYSNELWQRYHVVRSKVDLAPAPLITLVTTAPDTVVATWDGGGSLKLRDLATADELREWAKLPAGRGEAEVEDRLRLTVNDPLVQLEAKRRKIAEIPEIAAGIAAYRDTAVEDALFTQYVLNKANPSEADLRAYYDTHKEQFVEPEQRHVAQILVATEKEAADLRAQIEAGTDFGKLARTKSRDSGTAMFEGNLGWITAAKVPAEFKEVLSLKAGEVSKPIHSEHGWHLIKLTEIRPPRQMDFDEIREDVAKRAAEDLQQNAQKVWVAKLRAAATININDKAIADFVAANEFSEKEASAPTHKMN